MLDHLDGLGVRVPVATTQMWGGMNLCGLPPLTAGGIIDVHSYGEAEALSANPAVRGQLRHLPGHRGGPRQAGRDHRMERPLSGRRPLHGAVVRGRASRRLQGWDAPMIYNYSQRPFSEPDRQGTWSTFTDPALTGHDARRGDPLSPGARRPAKKTYCLMLDRQKLYYEPSHPKNMAAPADARRAEQGHHRPARRQGARLGRPNRSRSGRGGRHRHWTATSSRPGKTPSVPTPAS